jgi:ABC-type xylose transport system permease subunit
MKSTKNENKEHRKSNSPFRAFIVAIFVILAVIIIAVVTTTKVVVVLVEIVVVVIVVEIIEPTTIGRVIGKRPEIGRGG